MPSPLGDRIHIMLSHGVASTFSHPSGANPNQQTDPFSFSLSLSRRARKVLRSGPDVVEGSLRNRNYGELHDTGLCFLNSNSEGGFLTRRIPTTARGQTGSGGLLRCPSLTHSSGLVARGDWFLVSYSLPRVL